MAKVICVEGPDQVGKATQSKLLVDYLVDKGFKAVRVEVPINDNFTHKILYWMLRNGLAKKLPNAFQWLHFVNRRIFQCSKMRTLLKENDYVILDRWSLSSVVYGEESGASKKLIDFCYEHLYKPHASIVIVVPSHSNRKDDDYEKDDSLQMRVRRSYRTWATFHSDCVLIDDRNTAVGTHALIILKLKAQGLI